MKCILTSAIVVLGLSVLIPTLPSTTTYWLTLSPLIILPWLTARMRLALAVVAISWSLSYLQMHQDVTALQWSKYSSGLIIVQGQIVDVVKHRQRFGKPSQQFDFRVDQLEQGDETIPSAVIGRSIRLVNYGQSRDFYLGQRLRLGIKVKPLSTLNNTEGFDYIRYQLGNNIIAQGRVDQYFPVSILAQRIDRYSLRALLRERLFELSRELSRQSIILALAVGDRSLMSAGDKVLLQATGVAHLLAISGLHVGLAALLAYGAVMLIARVFVRPLWWRGLHPLACLASVLGGFYYAMLAGFTLSSVRALIMLQLFIVCRLLWRRTPRLEVWLIALWLALLYEPLQIYSAGLWLSFTAVLALIYLAIGGQKLSWLSTVGVFLLMIVPTSLLFSQLSFVAPVMNIIAIPLVSFLVVPLILLASLTAFVIPALSQWLLSCSDIILGYGLEVLASVYHYSGASYPLPSLPWYSYIFVVLSVLLVCMPRGMPGRWAALILLLPAVVVLHHDRGIESPLTVSVLDVGQGLAVVIITPQAVVVYDTGFGDGKAFALGGRVVSDYLQSLGINHIDHLIISHDDSDHAGGAGEILRRLNVAEIIVADPAMMVTPYQGQVSLCRAGLMRDIGGASLNVLWPDREQGGLSDNNYSCVVMIRFDSHAILLPGDIELPTEQRLVNHYGSELSADILLVPHHGSHTSSTQQFISAVAPRLAIVSAGRYNRFYHPHYSVVRRLEKNHIRWFNTASSGQLTLQFDDSAGGYQVRSYLQSYKRYWQ